MNEHNEMNAISIVFFALLHFIFFYHSITLNVSVSQNQSLRSFEYVHIIYTINSPVNTAAAQELYNNRGRSSMGCIDMVAADFQQTE